MYNYCWETIKDGQKDILGIKLPYKEKVYYIFPRIYPRFISGIDLMGRIDRSFKVCVYLKTPDRGEFLLAETLYVEDFQKTNQIEKFVKVYVFDLISIAEQFIDGEPIQPFRLMTDFD